MFKFLKHTKSKAETTLTIYTPVHHSNVLSYAHVISTFTPQPKEGEEVGEPKVIEYLAMQTVLVAEQARTVPLRALKRIGQKQDKSNHEQYFLTEEVVKVMEPIVERIDNKEDIDRIVKFLEENAV